MKTSLTMLFATSLLYLLFMVGTTQAETLNLNLGFEAPSQSMWGPNGASFNFRASGIVGSSSTAGIGYDIGASTGTVEGSFNGILGLNYSSHMATPGTSAISMNFTGTNNGGIVSSALGAWVNIDGYLLGTAHDLYDKGYSLQVDAPFTPQIGSTVSGSDAFVVKGVGIDLYFAGASLDLDLQQNDYFSANGISGTMLYKHRESGLLRQASFNLSSNDPLSINANLDRAGIWDFSFLPFSLENEFKTDFDLELMARAFYKTLDIPHWWEFWNAHWDTHSTEYDILGLDIYDVDPFSLRFNPDVMRPDVFSVTVMNPVPEPATIVLLSVGIICIAARRKFISK